MEDIKDFYFLCEPIETKLGKLRYIKVKEYPEFIKYIHLLSLQKFEILKLVNPEFKDIFEPMTMLELIKYFKQEDFALYQLYKKLFQFCFKEDVFDLIENDEEFEYYRDLMRKVNHVPYDPPNPNPEIEKFNKWKRILNQKNNDNITLESMYSSVWVATGYKPDELTIYELNMLFNRVAMFKNYDTSILFKSVSPTDITIESWYKQLEEEQKKMTLDEFSKKGMSVFN